MNNVMTISRSKDTYIQVRIRDDLKEDVQKTAVARGLTMSALIHSLLTQAVREEKEAYPDAFKIVRVENMGETTDERKPKRKTG